MPISFPAKPQGFTTIQARNLISKPFDYVPAPNMGNPNFRFMADTLGAGRGKIYPRANPRNPGVDAGKQFAISNRDNRPQVLRDNALWKEDDGTLNMALSGVSRDNAGNALGNCRVLIFRTEDNSFVGETVSDGAGVWSILMMKGGPFFFVEYLTGSPDRVGSTVNTLSPLQVSSPVDVYLRDPTGPDSVSSAGLLVPPNMNGRLIG